MNTTASHPPNICNVKPQTSSLPSASHFSQLSCMPLLITQQQQSPRVYMSQSAAAQIPAFYMDPSHYSILNMHDWLHHPWLSNEASNKVFLSQTQSSRFQSLFMHHCKDSIQPYWVLDRLFPRLRHYLVLHFNCMYLSQPLFKAVYPCCLWSFLVLPSATFQLSNSGNLPRHNWVLPFNKLQICSLFLYCMNISWVRHQD